jgi:hypothetical protein
MNEEARAEERTERLSQLFALLTCKLEDAAGIAAECQGRRPEAELIEGASRIAELTGEVATIAAAVAVLLIPAAEWCHPLCLVKEPPQGHTQPFGELVDHRDGRIAGPALEIADIGPMDPDLECEGFLRQPALGAQHTQVTAKAIADIRGEVVALKEWEKVSFALDAGPFGLFRP